MLNICERKIIGTVESIYHLTENRSYGGEVCKVDFEILVPSIGGLSERIISIERSTRKEDLTWKLYTSCDDKPLITTFGCWPPGYVCDIFIKALEHFYNDY